ncbi:PAS domain-containing protein [Actinomycetospora succinea]|uniref:PAS domain-containing protein n=1 Tax=Actinomycetospora succinea TaxID=663603 RepID=A0A4R6VIR6_9PSEU|nr:PAS domain-containing protein [Actinomycetospora succinea]TDQ63157.1 PAS domain-containing protein [Actinomycetospora succinea]
MITNRDLAVIPGHVARAALDAARAEMSERLAHRLMAGSLDRVQRVLLRLLARASLSDRATRVALRAEADELDAAVRAARDIIFSCSGPPPAPADPPVETALLDADGVIVWVDETWEEFCLANGGDPARTGVGRSFLALCDEAAATDDHSGVVAAAIRAALEGDLPAPTRVEVPCHAPTRPRFFDVLISSRRDDHGRVLGATVTLSEAVAAPVQPRPV